MPFWAPVAEIAAESRSMHKSQGFGSARQRGRETEYFKLLAGDSTATMFDGIIDDWSRLKGTAALQAALQAAEKAYSIDKPEAMLPELLKARTALMQLPRTVEVTDALSRLERLWANWRVSGARLLPINSAIPMAIQHNSD